MRKTWARAGLLLVLGALALGAQARTDGEHAVATVGERLTVSDCDGAIKALNTGLQARYPEVALLAGTMFEVGICVKKDWSKALQFYSQASAGGMKEGALRLAAGFAAEANGPDMGAAMWWARQAGLEAGRCTDRLPKTDDPDRFVEELRKWPQRELEECNYVVGMISFLTVEVNYPMVGIENELDERLYVTFTPATSYGSIKPRDGRSSTMRVTSAVWSSAAHYAGARYKRPADISSSWKIPFVVSIHADKSRWWAAPAELAKRHKVVTVEKSVSFDR